MRLPSISLTSFTSHDPARRPPFSIAVPIAALASLILSGCGSPSAANIALRKQIQQLQTQIDQMHLRHDQDLASIRVLQGSAATIPSLAADELDKLFTVAGLQFGRLTGGDRSSPNDPADTSLRIEVVPIDQRGDPIKAAGAFRIDLFDLALANDNRVGTWDFDLAATRTAWRGGFLLYTYVLDCPWQTVPTHANLLAQVTFTDELTHRQFIVNHEVIVAPLPPKVTAR